MSKIKEVTQIDITTPYWKDLLPAAIITIVYLACVILPNWLICFCTKNSRDNACLPRFVVIVLICELGLSIAAMILTFKALNTLNHRNKLLKELDKAV